MWQISEINPRVEYELQLCQDKAGKRTFCLRPTGGEPQPDAVLVTAPVPGCLLVQRNLFRLAEEVRLVGGQRFEFDAHGIWFTKEEMDALDDEIDVPWCTKQPPVLPSR